MLQQSEPDRKFKIDTIRITTDNLNPKFGSTVGSESFLEEIEEKMKSLKYDSEIPVLKTIGEIRPEMIIQLVAEFHDITIEFLLALSSRRPTVLQFTINFSF